MARQRKAQSQPDGMPNKVWDFVIAGRRCGAKTKKGGWCRRSPYLAKSHQEGPGPWRCRFHGGVQGGQGAPMGNQHATTHGIYARAMTEEERETFEAFDVRNVDLPIRMVMLSMQRAFIKQHEQEVALDGDPETDHALYLTERKVVTGQDETGGELTQRTTVRRRYDYHAIIDRLVGQLCKLLSQKVNLEGDGEVDPNDIAKKVRAAIGDVKKNGKIASFVHLPLSALGVANADQN